MFISQFLQSVAEEFTETAPHRYTMEIVTYFRITPFEQSGSVSTRQVMGKNTIDQFAEWFAQYMPEMIISLMTPSVPEAMLRVKCNAAQKYSFRTE